MLSTGTLCDAIQEALDQNQVFVPSLGFSSERRHLPPTQVNVLYAVMALTCTDGQLQRLPKPSARMASLVFRNMADVWPEVTQLAKQDGALQIIQNNFQTYMVLRSQLNDQKLRRLWTSLRLAIRDTSPKQLPSNLSRFAHINETMLSQTDRFNMICECIHWCLTSPNKENQQPTTPAFRRKPCDILSYDPYGNDGKFSRSGAVHILLHEETEKEEKVLYDGYNYERFIEYTAKNSLLIRNIDCSLGVINVRCAPRETCRYQLRRIEDDQFGLARDFVYQYEHEFKRKKWWKDSLPNMIYRGLSLGVWTAYAFFDMNGRIAAYVDFKIRTDGDFEIGTQLTAKEARGQGLATSLINFIRLKYINTCFFTGTYEENGPMKHVFEKIGFQETLFYDPNTGESSNRIQERINPDFPDDESKMTNSIYYHIISIMEDAKLGAVSSNSEDSLTANF